MYSLQIVCSGEEVDVLSGDLWEAGTVGVQEVDRERPDSSDDLDLRGVLLIASFETNADRLMLLERFAAHSPEWKQQSAIDWVAETQRAWPGREVGTRFFLSPPWCADATPPDRLRLMHNPGLACGTGEHVCTQLALIALERCIRPLCKAVDVGTGSGVLAIAALQLGAALAVGLDTDEAALEAARENFALNQLIPTLATGSADCMADGCADVVVANISATVLISIAADLLSLLAKEGFLILTGFQEPELATVQNMFATAEVTSSLVFSLDDWNCLCLQFSAQPAPVSDPAHVPAVDRH
jgi:ribosomal protein L11 methyltransferase